MQKSLIILTSVSLLSDSIFLTSRKGVGDFVILLPPPFLVHHLEIAAVRGYFRSLSLLGTLPKGMFAPNANDPSGCRLLGLERDDDDENRVPIETEVRTSCI